MGERGGTLGFAFEASDDLLILRELLPESLQGYVAVQLPIAGQVDLGHSSATYEPLGDIPGVGGRVGRRRRTLFGQVGDNELEDPLGIPRVLQRVFAEVPEFSPELRIVYGVAHVLVGVGREQHLPAAPRREQARR